MNSAKYQRCCYQLALHQIISVTVSVKQETKYPNSPLSLLIKKAGSDSIYFSGNITNLLISSLGFLNICEINKGVMINQPGTL